MNKLFAALAIVLAGVGAWFYFRRAAPVYDLVGFAQCLGSRPVTMYGASSCSHCQNQKKLFGEAWRFVPYVECTVETQKCLERKVDGYPTWVFPDGSRLVGEQPLEKLARQSACLLQSKKE